MSKRDIKKGTSSKASDVNGEGNEKDDNTSSSISDLQGYSVHDNNPKIAGMSRGYMLAQQAAGVFKNAK